MLNVFVSDGMIVEITHEIVSFKQRKWLEKYINFNTQRRNRFKKVFEKDFYKLLNTLFYGKLTENVRNRIRLEVIKKDDTKNIIRQQSKLVSMEFITHMKFVIGIHSNKKNLVRINQSL